MKCYTCKERMQCVDDMNDMTYRADCYRCPVCNSTALIEYGDNGEYIDKVEWKRHTNKSKENEA